MSDSEKLPFQEAPANPEFEAQVPRFLQKRLQELLEIQRAHREGDFETLSSIAHKWIDFSAPYGFGYLETLAIELENEALRENAAQCEEVLHEIERYLAQKKLTLT
ncbi:MAG: hypothetical protein KDD52_03735 [Bdellovibrionales bacterium]|nr:hypothetical protein [Bdellovibrionales bacterium]